MKKYFLTILGILAVGLTFAYTPTQTDTDILDSVYPRLDKIIENNKTKAENIMNKISEIKEGYAKNQELYYILGQIYNYLDSNLGSSKGNSVTSSTLSGDNSIFSGNIYKATVIEIIDGDTIKVQLSGTTETIRMIGIDAPESYAASGYIECGGEESYNHIKSLLSSGDAVELETDTTQGERDRYSRILAFVFFSGTNINEQMIKDGYAWEYTYDKDYKYKDNFVKAQDYAKQKKLGIYSADLCNGKKYNIDSQDNPKK